MTMKKIFTVICAALICGTTLSATAQSNTSSSEGPNPSRTRRDTVDFSNQPKRQNNKYPLSDQKNSQGWKLDKAISDEFNGSSLNESRWYPNNPGWKGRIPTQFHPSNVEIKDGYAVFSINQHGDEELLDGYEYSAGFIVSKNEFTYGYIEASLKINNSPWVGGFWMSNHQKDWWTEIDICENCPGVETNAYNLNSNLHVFFSPEDQGNIKKHINSPKGYCIPFRLEEDFHVWGLEWDKEFIRFYIDGVMFREVKNEYWHQQLHININNESNKWLGATPNGTGVDKKYLVDYVRVWQKK